MPRSGGFPWEEAHPAGREAQRALPRPCTSDALGLQLSPCLAGDAQLGAREGGLGQGEGGRQICRGTEGLKASSLQVQQAQQSGWWGHISCLGRAASKSFFEADAESLTNAGIS